MLVLVKFHVFPARIIVFTHPSQRLLAIKFEVIILLENNACKMDVYCYSTPAEGLQLSNQYLFYELNIVQLLV